jgi:hypothetical protein
MDARARVEVYQALKAALLGGDVRFAMDEMHNEVTSPSDAIQILMVFAMELIEERFADQDDPLLAATEWLDQRAALAQQEADL